MPYTFVGDAYVPDPGFVMPAQPWADPTPAATPFLAPPPQDLTEEIWSPQGPATRSSPREASPSVEMDFDEEPGPTLAHKPLIPDSDGRSPLQWPYFGDSRFRALWPRSVT